MELPLMSDSYLWFECLYKYVITEGFVLDEEENPEDSNSDSSWIGLT